MAWGFGHNLVCALKKASTWGTSVAANAANAGFRAISFSWQDNIEELADMSYNNDVIKRERTNRGRYRVGGSFLVDAKVQGLDTMIALFLGTAGVPAGGGPYTHTLYRKSDMTGLFFTLIWYDGQKTHEIDSAKFTGMTARGSAGGKVQLEFRWQGRRRQENTGTNANVSSVTENSAIDNAQITAAIADYQIAAFADALADISLNTWELVWEREYADDDRVFSSANSPYRDEMPAGEALYNGTFTKPYEETTYITTAVQGGGIYKMKLLHEVTDNQKELGFWLPSVKFLSGTANIQDRGGIPQTLQFVNYLPSSTPSGFTQPYPYITLINSNSANPLA